MNRKDLNNKVQIPKFRQANTNVTNLNTTSREDIKNKRTNETSISSKFIVDRNTMTFGVDHLNKPEGTPKVRFGGSMRNIRE